MHTFQHQLDISPVRSVFFSHNVEITRTNPFFHTRHESTLYRNHTTNTMVMRIPNRKKQKKIEWNILYYTIVYDIAIINVLIFMTWSWMYGIFWVGMVYVVIASWSSMGDIRRVTELYSLACVSTSTTTTTNNQFMLMHQPTTGADPFSVELQFWLTGETENNICSSLCSSFSNEYLNNRQPEGTVLKPVILSTT